MSGAELEDGGRKRGFDFIVYFTGDLALAICRGRRYQEAFLAKDK
jgi:hypothetical protein